MRAWVADDIDPAPPPPPLRPTPTSMLGPPPKPEGHLSDAKRISGRRRAPFAMRSRTDLCSRRSHHRHNASDHSRQPHADGPRERARERGGPPQRARPNGAEPNFRAKMLRLPSCARVARPACFSQQGVRIRSRWLHNLTIKDDLVVDGNGEVCNIVCTRRGPRLCGGLLKRKGSSLVRIGKSGNFHVFLRSVG